MNQVQVRHSDSPIQGHFIINDSERSRQHVIQPLADGSEYVCIGFEHVAKIIASLMVRMEAPKNDLDKANAEGGYDQICGFLGSHGIIVNAKKIRAELCADCLGLGTPGTAIINADMAAKAEITGASAGPNPVSTGV